MQSLKQLKDAIQNPGAIHRSAPFWSWNDCLEPERLVQQVQGMHNAGMGGFFIHSREGLETPYLSEEWMDCVAAVLKESHALGMKAWIYDDDKWPSGNAGGAVGQGVFSAKALTMERIPAGTPAPHCMVLFDFSDFSVMAQDDSSKTRLAFFMESSDVSDWYNGSAPADMLDPAATDRFLELTHEAYAKRFGADMPQMMQGFFTDEPNFCDFFSRFTAGRPWLPWTGVFADFFEEKRGYSILPRLPHLFYDYPDAGKTRHDYWRTLTERFDEAYCKKVFDWCSAHHVRLTGHMLYENDLGYGARVCGAAMPHYRYLHAPGIDLLGDQTSEYLTVKQCTSVANQMGQEQVITETYGCTGWDFSFASQKRLMDWQFAMGVNLRCQHLAPYSIRGCRKRDYPPVFHHQTTWWRYNPLIESYCGRLSACVKAGEVVRPILMIHPMSSIWMACKSAPEEDLSHVEMNMGWLDPHILRLNKTGAEYERAARLLLGAHWDFDFGDETILAESATAAQGRITVGKASYDAVVVPCVKTLFSSTADLLERFLMQGGQVFWVAPFPACVNGAPEATISRLLQYDGLHLFADYESMVKALESKLPRVLRVSGTNAAEDSEIVTMVRRLDDGYFIFAANPGSQHRTARMHFSVPGRVEECDLFTGLFKKITTGNAWIADLPACGSKAYFVSPEECTCSVPPFPYIHPHRADHTVACLGPCASFTRSMDNTLPLDICSYQIGDGEWSQPMPVWQAQREIRKALDMRQVYYNGAPQRYTWLGMAHPKDKTPFSLRFTYHANWVPEKLWVAVEDASRFQIRHNGILCQKRDGFLLDERLNKLPISQARQGENELTISGNYMQDMELEDIYLGGDFAVDLQRCLIAEPKTLHFGDWCMQGYPHYAGAIIYTFQVESPPAGLRIQLKLGAYHATVGEVRVNGERAGYLIGEAMNSAEVTRLLRPGSNTIEIELCGSPRNLFGPFHQAYTGCSRISWEDFRTQGTFETKEYVLQSYGLYGQVILCVMENDLEETV